jgi:hypothetical protein
VEVTGPDLNERDFLLHILAVLGSDADQDPEDPYVFGSPGSRSIPFRDTDPDPSNNKQK